MSHSIQLRRGLHLTWSISFNWLGDTMINRHRLVQRFLAASLLSSICLLAIETRAEDALRCGQDIVQVGDSRERVLKQCGQPSVSEKYCAPVSIPEHQRRFGNVCTPGEKFIYTYEPSSIRKTVEFIDGKVYRIY